jgi:putative cell wall-binding protein
MLVLVVVLAVVAGLVPASVATSPHDDGPLEVEARPSLALTGETVTVAAEYEPDDGRPGKPDDGPSEPDDDGPGDGDDDDRQGRGHGREEGGRRSGGRPDHGAPVQVTFTVDFGDGTAAETMTARMHNHRKAKAVAHHAYAAEGRYEVVVTATTAEGATTAARTVQVGAGAARLEGDDRYATAARLSREDFPDDGAASAVLLARADSFADALSSAGVAVLARAPVLLTDRAAVPPAVLEEIARALGEDGVVYLLGGEAAIDPQVAGALEQLGYRVERIAGDDRVDTALRLARFLLDAGVDLDEVVVAPAGDFPDALSGAAQAARRRAPVLLTAGDRLDPRVAAFLGGLNGVRVRLVGGEAVLSAAVEADLVALGLDVRRIAGGDRYATSVAVASQLGEDVEVVVLATGRSFPDALAGAPAAGRRGAPVLLVGDTLPEPVRAWLAAHAGQVRRLYVLGGPSAVPSAVTAEAEALLGLAAG